jgi:L-2,4-diaminobutyrate decarboxylase
MVIDGEQLEQARARIGTAYDPSLLKDAGQRLAGLLEAQLAEALGSQGPVVHWEDPGVNVDRAGAYLTSASPDTSDSDALARHFSELVQTMLAHGLNLHDPRYIGHQVPASVPLAGLFDAVGSVTNQVMAIYEIAPWASAVEWALVRELGRRIGWAEDTFSGLITHGGSLANLTALLTARNVRLARVWEKGVRGEPVIVTHADAHYCVVRAAGILGLGTGGVIPVGLDNRRRMDPDRLDATLARLRREGRPIVAAVACACATPIGAFDPLEAIAQVCERHEVWLHVDAAHGAAACFSERHRSLVTGLQRADSVVWDAHKMLFMPALCAFVFYKDKSHRFASFQQDAPYLFDPSAPGLADYDSGLRTVECTKRAAGFGLWGVWALFGPQLFADMVDVTFATARILYDKLCEAQDFEALHEPECNIVAFRYIPNALRDAPRERLNEFQLALRRRLVESGAFYIVSTVIDGVAALRVTIINPFTGAEHLDLLMETLRREGGES